MNVRSTTFVEQTAVTGDPISRLKAIIGCLEAHRGDICKALRYGGNVHTFEYVCARVLSGSLDLFKLPNSVIICEKIVYEKLNVYNVFIVGGNLQEILGFETFDIHNEARKRGCSFITFTGRQGWARPLIDRGWTPLNITMMKEVDNG